jgi:hypothetical protein
MLIVDFILARLAEEEGLALLAPDGREPRNPGSSDAATALANHWSPRRVHAACIMRLLLLDIHQDDGPAIVPGSGGHPDLVAATCQTCRDRDGHPAPWPCDTIRVLAGEWVHHPDYRHEWRPQRLRNVGEHQA